MSEVLLDTDILSNLMKGNEVVVRRAQEYLSEYEQFSFSIITRYEILRGLRAKGAYIQEAKFDTLCSSSKLYGINDLVVKEAAGIYADLRNQGTVIGDADILIAATARVNGLRLSTNNQKHFGRIKGLETGNWLQY